MHTVMSGYGCGSLAFSIGDHTTPSKMEETCDVSVLKASGHNYMKSPCQFKVHQLCVDAPAVSMKLDNFMEFKLVQFESN